MFASSPTTISERLLSRRVPSRTFCIQREARIPARRADHRRTGTMRNSAARSGGPNKPASPRRRAGVPERRRDPLRKPTLEHMVLVFITMHTEKSMTERLSARQAYHSSASGTVPVKAQGIGQHTGKLQADEIGTMKSAACPAARDSSVHRPPSLRPVKSQRSPRRPNRIFCMFTPRPSPEQPSLISQRASCPQGDALHESVPDFPNRRPVAARPCKSLQKRPVRSFTRAHRYAQTDWPAPFAQASPPNPLRNRKHPPHLARLPTFFAPTLLSRCWRYAPRASSM